MSVYHAFGARWRAALAALAAALALAACGGGVPAEDEHEHENVFIDTAGRLAVAEVGSATLRILDLDSRTVEASYTMDNEPSAVYASPGGRYAVVVQRTQDRVQFVDGGIWQEDHGDHLHDYRQSSRLLSWRLTGPRPTHYDVQAGVQAAFFLDGNASATPPQNAGVRLLTDASIGSGQTLATIDLSFPIHGLAEPVGQKLLTVARAADAPDTLPTHLVLYRRSGATWTPARQLPTRCDGMHGSFSSGSHTVVGCLGGMLRVRHLSATDTDDGAFIATASRVGTVAGHPRLPDHFIGIGNDGTAPNQTTRFFALDAASGTAAEFVPQGWTTGRLRRAHTFDRSGSRFFILDDQGTLLVMQRAGSGWTTVAHLPGTVPSMPTAAPWPAFAANGARDEVYLTDRVARQLIVLNAATGAVIERRNLGFEPGTLAWMGITR
jgi:hypothetical protein